MPLSANLRGILALTVCMAAFASNDLIVKHVIRTLPIGEVLVIRAALTVLLLGLMLPLTGQLNSLAIAALTDRIVLLRACAEGVATSFFTVAMLYVAIAAASAITMMSPLIITVLSVVLFKEQVGWRRTLAIVAGALGVLMVAQPSPGAFNPWMLLPVACALGSATRDLLTKNLDPRLPTAMVSLVCASFVGIVGGVISLHEGWRAIDIGQFGVLAATAALLALGNYFMVVAFRGVDLSVVAPFRYSYLLWTALGGYVFFSELLDAIALLGAFLIVLSGLYTLHRERVRKLEKVADAEKAGLSS